MYIGTIDREKITDALIAQDTRAMTNPSAADQYIGMCHLLRVISPYQADRIIDDAERESTRRSKGYDDE